MTPPAGPGRVLAIDARSWILGGQHAVIRVAIRTRGRDSEPTLDHRPAVDAFEVARDRRAVVVSVVVFAVAVATDLHNVQREGARLAIGFVEDVMRAVAGNTHRRIRVTLRDRFCVSALEVVRLCSLMAAR